MANLTLSVLVARAELSLSDLQLSDPSNGYEVFGVGPGALSWRRESVRSPYINGETLVGAVKDVMSASLGVRIRASSAATLDSRLDTVLDAFGQFTYNVTVVIDGVSRTWKCEPADYSVSEGEGGFNKFNLMNKYHEVSFSIPRQPIPVSGTV